MLTPCCPQAEIPNVHRPRVVWGLNALLNALLQHLSSEQRWIYDCGAIEIKWDCFGFLIS